MPTQTMYRNLAIFLKFWSNSGYFKSLKALDLFFIFIAFWLHICSQQKNG
jgi:ABC-type multidrug transport system permease subunit